MGVTALLSSCDLGAQIKSYQQACGVRSSVAAGGSMSLAVVSDGTVRAWGTNWAGQLGVGDTNPRNSPTQVTGLTNVVSVAAGSVFSLALKSDGTVWAWGQNHEGEAR